MYSEFVSDPKVQLLAFEDQRHFIALLCLKCNETLDSDAPSPNYRDRMIAKALGLSPDAAMEAKRRLVEVGLIDADWQPTKWDARQYDSDSSTARTRAYRERQREQSHETSQERSENVTVTDKSRAEQSREGRKRPAKRCPPDFVPDLAYASAEVPDMDAEEESRKFRDWEFKTPRSDWAACWRTWVRNARESGRYAKRRPMAGSNPLNPHAHLDMR
jgi:hypothetical protein